MRARCCDRKSQPLLDLGTKIMMLRWLRFTNPKILVSTTLPTFLKPP